jgi:hypothetical protein
MMEISSKPHCYIGYFELEKSLINVCPKKFMLLVLRGSIRPIILILRLVLLSGMGRRPESMLNCVPIELMRGGIVG